MEVLAFLAIFACGPAAIAASKGRSFFGWWIYGFLLLPITLVHALMLKPDRKSLDAKAMAEGGRKCPHCAEIIRREAKVCRFCSRDVN